MFEYYEQEVRSAANCSYSNGHSTLQHWPVTAAAVTATLDSGMNDFHFARKKQKTNNYCQGLVSFSFKRH